MTDERYAELTTHVQGVKDDPNYAKCPRCWHYTREGLFNFDGLCDRCSHVLVEAYPDHESVPHILKNRAEQLKERS